VVVTSYVHVHELTSPVRQNRVTVPEVAQSEPKVGESVADREAPDVYFEELHVVASRSSYISSAGL
jgi:hypothetical protein